MKNPFKNLGKNINDAEKKARDLANQLAQKAKDLQAQAERLKKDADQKAHDLANAATAEAKKLAQKAHDDAQKAADHAKTLAENAGKDLKKANKNVKKRLQDLSGKIRQAYKKLLRKSTLAGVYSLIRINASGVATLLYPSIAPATEIKNRKIKASFIPESKSAYAKVLAKWTSLGGKESKLNDAITAGSKLNISKSTASYYPPKGNTSPIKNITTAGIQPVSGIKKAGLNGNSQFSGEVDRYSLPFPNNSGMSNFIQVPVSANYKVEIFSGCGGMMSSADGTDPNAVSTETLTPEEQAALDNYDISDTQPEEKHAHWKAFIAWIKSLFKKKETPYENGSTADTAFKDQLTTDDATAPELTAEDLANLAGIDPTIPDPADNGDSKVSLGNEGDGSGDSTPADDTIWGVNKYVVYIGVPVVAVGAVWGIIKLVNHFKKGKSKS
jgi:F0F1-type ATP synthase membrane subunit b/b'